MFFSITLVQDSQRTAREACEAPDSAMSMHEMPLDIVNPIQILYYTVVYGHGIHVLSKYVHSNV